MGYREIDESGRTDDRVNATRAIRAFGFLIHTTAGHGSLAWLMGGSAEAGKPASADFLIDRDGTRHRISPPGRYAYHAGKGRVKVRDRLYQDDAVSQILIGIEIEQELDQDITREQYFSLAELIQRESLTWAMPGDYALYGHYATARPLGRRSDPCNFDWGVLRAILDNPAIQLPLPHIGE